MGMGGILLLEISTPVNLNLLWFLILLKKEQIPEYLVSSPSVLRCPHVRPAVSLSYFNPQVFQTVRVTRDQLPSWAGALPSTRSPS